MSGVGLCSPPTRSCWVIATAFQVWLLWVRLGSFALADPGAVSVTVSPRASAGSGAAVDTAACVAPADRAASLAHGKCITLRMGQNKSPRSREEGFAQLLGLSVGCTRCGLGRASRARSCGILSQKHIDSGSNSSASPPQPLTQKSCLEILH